MSKILKKLSYALLIGMLSTGAALTLGLLSFGGMYALVPFWQLAAASFGLSSIYEWEIYFQNIRGALNKLFLSQNYLQNKLGNAFLREHCPTESAENEPAFFREYKRLLHALHELEHAQSNDATAIEIKSTKAKLHQLEEYFSKQLFNKNAIDENAAPLNAWLNEHLAEQRHAIQATLKRRRRLYRIAAAFSLFFSSAFMGLGTVYLLSETLAILPFLGSVPFLASPMFIIPLAIVAGAAYGLLTFNAITDMINNDTIKKMIAQYKKPWKEIFSLKTIGTTFLIALALILTICTAGTWWTVAKQVKPIVSHLAKLPKFIMGVINPIITGLSALAFNWQNTVETLSTLEEGQAHRHAHAANTPHRKSFSEKVSNAWQGLRERENWGQILNPFRLILLLIIPLRALFFLGHLVSIGVTGDRMPKIPQALSALFGIISEGFEDWHYFFSHHHAHTHSHNHTHQEEEATDMRHLLDMRLAENTHSHNHDTDLPIICIKIAFSPIFLLGAIWNWSAKKLIGAPPPANKPAADTPLASNETQLGEPILSSNNDMVVVLEPVVYYGQGMQFFDHKQQPEAANLPADENNDKLHIQGNTVQ